MNEPVTIYGNETLTIEDGPDGPFFVLYPFVWGTGYGSIRRVVIERQRDGRWRTTVPLMPGIAVDADTRDDAKRALADAVKTYLRRRIAYIRDAASLVQHYISADPTTPGAAYARVRNVPVWKIIRDAGDAFVASARGDDTALMDPAAMHALAERYDLDDDALRAVVAYYLDHKAEIRNAVVHGNLARADDASAHLQALTGLTDDEFADALALPSSDT